MNELEKDGGKISRVHWQEFRVSARRLRNWRAVKKKANLANFSALTTYPILATKWTDFHIAGGWQPTTLIIGRVYQFSRGTVYWIVPRWNWSHGKETRSCARIHGFRKSVDVCVPSKKSEEDHTRPCSSIRGWWMKKPHSTPITSGINWSKCSHSHHFLRMLAKQSKTNVLTLVRMQCAHHPI